MTKRVAITGLGVVSPLGNDLLQFCDALLRGESGITRLSRFAAGALESQIVGECRVTRRSHKDIKVDFALQAAEAAINDAGSEGRGVLEHYRTDQCGISMGIGLELFEMNDMVRFAANGYHLPDPSSVDPCFLQTPGDLCVTTLRGKYGFQSPPAIHVSACAAATDAIGHAFTTIRRGRAQMVLTGGTDSMINPLGLAGFCKLRAVSTNNEDPAGASKPFDRRRDGFVLGEGAGMLVLENYDSALARGAAIYGEVLGYGNAFDTYSVSDPHPEGLGASLAIQRALHCAGIEPEQISYINAHGTSTLKNDLMETIAIRRVFGASADNIPVSSTKSMIGHLISAAGAVELIGSILCGRAGKVHPTINLCDPDPQCDLDYVAHHCRDHAVEYLLSNSFAFGGQNAALICRLNR